MNEKKNGGLWSLLGIFLVGVAILYATSFLVDKTGIGNRPQTNLPQTGTTTPISLQPTPYQEKNLMNSKVIVDSFANTVSNGKPSDSVIKTITVSGQLSSGYLYVVASVNGEALQTSDPNNYDDIYANLIKLTDQGTEASREYGGHLVSSASLETPTSPSQTELLYPLNNIGYIKSYKDT